VLGLPQASATAFSASTTRIELAVASEDGPAVIALDAGASHELEAALAAASIRLEA
jgi:hypothetical protein